MGNTPSVKYENMTTEEIVEAVKSLGKEFETCAQMVDLAGIDGAYLKAIADDEGLINESVETLIYNCQSLSKPLRRAILKKAFADLKQNIGKDKSPNTEDDIVRKSLCGTPPIIEMAMPFLCPQSSDSHNAS